MSNKNKKFYGRKEELESIDDFIKEEGAGVLFIKGRRRIGKTWILNKLKQTNRTRLFMYSGKGGSIKKECYQMLVEFERFFKDSKLTFLLKDSQEISPTDMFDRLSELLTKYKGNPIFLIDEVQWVGDDNGKEFSGTLKEKWTDLEINNKIKIIITGSSTRYFKEMLEHNEGVLRGISDRAHLVIPPFTLGEIKKYFFPNYTNEEVAFIHMITGGVAKYIDILKKKSYKKSTFIQCINKAFFIKDNYFITESEEMLTIDLDKTKGKESIKILSKIGANSIKLSMLESMLEGSLKNDLTILLEELELLEILGVKNEVGEIISDASVIKKTEDKSYFIKDSMLMFYYSVVYPRRNQIKINKNQLFFKDLIDSNSFTVISGFTGEAFERLFRDILIRRKINETPVFKKMDLLDPSYDVNCYRGKDSQIDCYVNHFKDKSFKIVECKWIGEIGSKSTEDYCDEVKRKIYKKENPRKYQYFYLFSIPLTDNRVNKMNENEVIPLILDDLFDQVYDD